MAISSFYGKISKVNINGVTVYPGTQKITLDVGKQLTIYFEYEAQGYGAGVLDWWTAGVTAKLGTQFGWNPTVHRGGDLKMGTPEIGNIKVPSGGGTLALKLYAIDATNPSAPPG